MNKLFPVGALALSILLFGCGGSGGGGDDGDGDNPIADDPPEISGKSIDYVRSGKDYEFTPTAYDPENGRLRYSIRNQPDWADFDPATGTLSGKPGDIAVGPYDEIVVSVSDGTNVVSLPPFSVNVMYAEVGRSRIRAGSSVARSVAVSAW